MFLIFNGSDGDINNNNNYCDAGDMIIVTVGIGIPTYDSMHSFILKNITKDNNNKDIGANNDHKW